MTDTRTDVRTADLADRSTTVSSIGRFAVVRELGSGGFGTVLLARDPTLDREVAIKLLHPGRGADGVAQMRLLREAQAMAKLRHPNVVSVHEAGRLEDRVYLVLEYVPGGTLRSRLAAPDVTPQMIVRWFAAAGSGLAAAHAAGLVHRDFKPDNVLVDESGVAKVTDFGLAARSEGPADAMTSGSNVDALALRLTITGDVMGTPRYMAPEQHEGKPTDERTDQYAFCVALYEALYRKPPFTGETYGTLRENVLRGSVARPPARPGVPPRVVAAMLRGLARDPADRFPMMGDLLAALQPPAARSRRAIVAGMLAVAALAAGVIVVIISGRHEAPTTIATRSARACNCELVTLELPPGAEVTAVRQLAGPLAMPPLAPRWQPTHQLAVPAGQHLIDYQVGGEQVSFAIVSRGPTSSRTIALPAPEKRDGYVFVPGGELSVGQPLRTVIVEPYLIGRTEAADNRTYAEAHDVARDAHARLPTAIEWEWAARLAVLEHPLERGWEWTATRFVLDLYLAGDRDRDDTLGPRAKSEVRGGSTSVTDRREGAHKGHADVRLARTAAVIPPVSSVDVETALELAQLDRFIVDWWQLDDRPPVQVRGGDCTVKQALWSGGVPARMIEEIDPGESSRAQVRWHPDRSYVNAKFPDDRKRTLTCDTSIEILDMICFDGIKISSTSGPIIKAISTTLVGNPAIELIEIQGYAAGPDSVALGQRRADAVRARVIADGVAAGRLTARGYSTTAVPPDPDGALFHEDASGASTKGCPHMQPGERIAFLILKRH